MIVWSCNLASNCEIQGIFEDFFTNAFLKVKTIFKPTDFCCEWCTVSAPLESSNLEGHFDSDQGDLHSRLVDLCLSVKLTDQEQVFVLHSAAVKSGLKL